MTTFPFFLSCFDIPVRFVNLFQRIASINDRFYLPGLNQPSKERIFFSAMSG